MSERERHSPKIFVIYDFESWSYVLYYDSHKKTNKSYNLEENVGYRTPHRRVSPASSPRPRLEETQVGKAPQRG